jgi:hypothetical protein
VSDLEAPPLGSPPKPRPPSSIGGTMLVDEASVEGALSTPAAPAEDPFKEERLELAFDPRQVRAHPRAHSKPGHASRPARASTVRRAEPQGTSPVLLVFFGIALLVIGALAVTLYLR